MIAVIVWYLILRGVHGSQAIPQASKEQCLHNVELIRGIHPQPEEVFCIAGAKS